MNRILKALPLLSTALVVQFAVSASSADQPGEPKSQVAADAPPVAGTQQTEPPAVPLFKIVPRHDSGGGDRVIQELAAELIGRQAETDRSVPEKRARHFSWIKLPIQGWTGEIRDLAITAEGLCVRVRVIPDLGGGCCAVGQYTDETYLITDGVAHLTAIAYNDPKWPRAITWN
ncbi:hypothetical protein [Paludisphaera borealis]|uniref:Uncharacterized protein n=1 Tax=Paludisphaera borealis TaxID=1387353 RepID=A0A1U7CQI5_9BACT|nr:hypothetical protein [Paludisphaera borealis]APW61197.1 hypothetical protein BSF38_02701 [Paludisphaera borealis]